MNRVAAPAALLLSLALIACSPTSPQDLLAKAKQAIEAKDAKTAQIHLKNALSQDGQLAEARFLLGSLLLQAGDAQGALVEFGKAAEAGFPAEQLAQLHAQALLERRELRKLVEQYGKTELADKSAQAALLLSLGKAQAGLARPEEAQASFERAAALGGDGSAEVELARLLAQRGQLEPALQQLETLLAQRPQQVAGWRLKGDLLQALRREPAVVRQAYERAVQEGPKSTEARLALIAHLLSARDLSAAEQQLAQAKAQIGNPPGLRYFAAVIDFEQGRLEPAHEQVQQLLKMSPDDPRLHLLAGQVEFLRNRFLPAESHLTRALASPAQALRGRLLLAQTYLRLDDPARSLQTLQPLLDDPVSGTAQARVHALTGEAYLQLGETRKAEEQFQRAAALDPKDNRSRTLLALGQVGQGQDARGLNELRELSDSFDSPMADLALISTFIRKGDHAEALKAIDAAERKLPQRGMVPALRAQVLLAQGKTAEATAALEEALRREPSYLPAAVQLARQSLQAQQPQQAVARLAAVVKADPSNVAAKLAWIAIRQQAGEPVDALESELRTLVREQPQVVRPRVALAQSQQRRGDLAAALSTAQEAVAALPKEPELHELLAELQLRQRQLPLATKSLQQAAALRPRAPEPLLRLAEVELMAGQPRDALTTVRKALELRAQHPRALQLQVLLEAELGNTAAARRLAKELQQLPGQEALGAAVEGDIEAAQQQHAVAVAAYRRALARNAALPEVPAKLVGVLRASGKTAEAEAFARDWLKDHPRDIGLLNYLGDVALNENRLADAKPHYERSLAQQPGQPLVLNNLGWILLQQRDLAGADKALREAVRLAPAEAAIHDSLAALHSAAGRHDDAVAAQRRAQQLDPNPVFRVGLARRLIAAGRKDAARDELLAVQQLKDRYPGQAEVAQLLTQL